MANELRAASQPSQTIYGILYGPTSLVWNGTTFGIYSSASYASYLRTMTELGASGVYTGDFPVSITTPGRYETIYYLAVGGTPAEGDLIIGTQSLNWDGTALDVAASVSTGYMTATDWLAYVIRAFKRTDKNTEILDATKDTIDELRLLYALEDDEVQIDLTDQITTLGEYILDQETDAGHLMNPIIVQDGNDGWELEKISKALWDTLYLPNVTDSSARGRPKKYAVYGGKYYIGPVPDKTDYVYKTSYTQDTRATITTGTTAVPMTNKYREVLRWGVLQRLFSDIVKNDDQAAKFGLLYDNGHRRIWLHEYRNKKGNEAYAFNDL